MGRFSDVFRCLTFVTLLSHFLRRNPISGKFHANECSFSMICEGRIWGEKVSRWAFTGRIYARWWAFTRPSFSAEKDEVQAKSGDFRRCHRFLAQKCDKSETCLFWGKPLVDRQKYGIGGKSCHTFENKSVTYFSLYLSGHFLNCHTCHTFL